MSKWQGPEECGGALVETTERGAWLCERCGFRTRAPSADLVCDETTGPACEHAACAKRYAREGRRDCLARTTFRPRSAVLARATPWGRWLSSFGSWPR